MGKNINNFEEFIKLNESSDDENISINKLMKKFNINAEEATEVDRIIDEILDFDDLDDRMDYVEQLSLFGVIEDDDKEDDIMEYLKDICLK